MTRDYDKLGVGPLPEGIELYYVKAYDGDTDRLRPEPFQPTLKNRKPQRRNLLDAAEYHLTTIFLLAVAALSAVASAIGIVVAGFAFMVVVWGGLHLVTASLSALPWELLALAVILALLWRAQGHNTRR